MSVYIELESDPFLDLAEEQGKMDAYALGRPGAGKPVRRPLRGIQIKPDSYAYFKVVDRFGKAIPLMDAGGEFDDPTYSGKGMTYSYTNFIVQATQQAKAEKQQLIPTFGEDFIFFFGAQPKVYQISGQLINTFDFSWANEFWYNYETKLRGTKCVEAKARVYFYCDGQLWNGYLLSISAQRTADMPHIVPIQLQMLVMEEDIIESIGDTAFPVYPDSQGVAKQSKMGVWERIQTGIEMGASAAAAMEAAQSLDFTASMSAALTMGDKLSSLISDKYARKGPVRSLIRDNYDEYIGAEIPRKEQGWWMKLKFAASIAGFASMAFRDMGGHFDAGFHAGWGAIAELQYAFGGAVASEPEYNL